MAKDGRGVPTVTIDNARVRVTEWRFAPGASTGPHRHEFAYVVVPLTTGRLAATGPAGDSVNELVTGQPYYRPAGSSTTSATSTTSSSPSSRSS